MSDGPRPLGPPGIRKRKSDVLNENGDPASPVSSRLRSRNSNSSSNSSSGCGVEDCLRTTCCCDYQDVSKEDSLKTGGENGECIRRSLASDSIVLLADDTNGNHHYAMDHELEKRQRFGSDILMALADKISGRKGGHKKQLLHPGDLSFLDQFNTSLTVMNCFSSSPSIKSILIAFPPPLLSSCAIKCSLRNTRYRWNISKVITDKQLVLKIGWKLLRGSQQRQRE